MPFVSLLLFYFIIILFLYFTYKNKKPLKWSEILNILTFNQYARQDDDIYRIPGPTRLPIYGTTWSSFGS